MYFFGVIWYKFNLYISLFIQGKILSAKENTLFGILLVLFQNEGMFKERSRKMDVSPRKKK